MKCKNCLQELQSELAYCPHRATKMDRPTAEEEAGTAFLDTLDKTIHSTLTGAPREPPRPPLALCTQPV